jgi:hypothetical protein
LRWPLAKVDARYRSTKDTRHHRWPLAKRLNQGTTATRHSSSRWLQPGLLPRFLDGSACDQACCPASSMAPHATRPACLGLVSGRLRSEESRRQQGPAQATAGDAERPTLLSPACLPPRPPALLFPPRYRARYRYLVGMRAGGDVLEHLHQVRQPRAAGCGIWPESALPGPSCPTPTQSIRLAPPTGAGALRRVRRGGRRVRVVLYGVPARQEQRPKDGGVTCSVRDMRSREGERE